MPTGANQEEGKIMAHRTLPDQFRYLIGAAPQSGTAVNGAWSDVRNAYFVQFIMYTGIVDNTATLDFKLQQAKTSAGGDAKDISKAAITRVTAHATNNDNKMYSILIRTSKLDDENGFYFVRPVIAASVASLVSASGVAYRINFVPEDENNLVEDVRVL